MQMILSSVTLASLPTAPTMAKDVAVDLENGAHVFVHVDTRWESELVHVDATDETTGERSSFSFKCGGTKMAIGKGLYASLVVKIPPRSVLAEIQRITCALPPRRLDSK